MEEVVENFILKYLEKENLEELDKERRNLILEEWRLDENDTNYYIYGDKAEISFDTGFREINLNDLIHWLEKYGLQCTIRVKGINTKIVIF